MSAKRGGPLTWPEILRPTQPLSLVKGQDEQDAMGVAAEDGIAGAGLEPATSGL